MESSFDQNYWTQRYQNQQTGWDLGKVSPPLQAYIDQLTQHDLAILIPGSGNSYEAVYLYKQGFKKVYILDISPEPLEHFAKNNLQFPENQILNQDFFCHRGYL